MKLCPVIALICATLIASQGIAPPSSLADGDVVTEPPLVKVPSVKGLHPAVAERRLKRWHFAAEYTALSNACAGTPPGGHILLQKPAPGALAPVFSTVMLQDSCRPKGPQSKVAVPKVTEGASVIRAYTRLRYHGLRVAIPVSFSVATLCLPSAYAQVPRAGTRVSRGTVVRLTELRCALASPGTPVPTPPPVVVPDLTNGSVTSAVDWADTSGLYWETGELAPLRPSWQMGLFDNYIMTGQDPAAGSTATQGMSLKLSATEAR